MDSIERARQERAESQLRAAEKAQAAAERRAAAQQGKAAAITYLRTLGAESLAFLHREGVPAQGPRTVTWREGTLGFGGTVVSGGQVSVRFPTGWILRSNGSDSWALTESGELLCIWRSNARSTVKRRVYEARPIAVSRSDELGNTSGPKHLTVDGCVTDTGMIWEATHGALWQVFPERVSGRSVGRPPAVRFEDALGACLVELVG